MSYEIYTTKGIILSYFPVGEADRIYHILTRDLGLVQARAISVRKEVSKLRGNLEPISLANVSLVRGKEHWRLTSSQVICTTSSTSHILRPLTLLTTLVQGELTNPELFDTVESTIFHPETEVSEETLAARILFHLGYLREEDLNLSKTELIKAINEGLKESHLVKM